MDILPAIDLRDGKCVRLLQGDYSKQIDYSDDPLAVARQFEQAGAVWLHVVDLDGAREGKSCNLPTIERIVSHTTMRVEVGGGLREFQAIETLIDAGVIRCIVGTRALEDWAWFTDLVQRPQCKNRIALGLDARDGRLAVRGWTEQMQQTAIEVAQRVAGWPLAAIIYTDIARDGMLQGPNVEATRQMAEKSKISVIASGGVTTIEDVRKLIELPIGGIIIGRSLYEKKIDLTEAIRLAGGISDGSKI